MLLTRDGREERRFVGGETAVVMLAGERQAELLDRRMEVGALMLMLDPRLRERVWRKRMREDWGGDLREAGGLGWVRPKAREGEARRGEGCAQ